MNLSAAWFDTPLLYAANALLALLLALGAPRAWQGISRNPQAAGIVLLLFAVLWSLRASLGQGQMSGMNYHLLGITLGALMIGGSAVLWLAAAFMLPYLLAYGGISSWNIYGLNTLANVLPAACISLTAQALCRRLPKNLFIYIFINGFAAAALGMMATGLGLTALFSFSDALNSRPAGSYTFPVFILLAWAEAFLSGLFTAVFIAFKPELLSGFDEKAYLKRKNLIWPSE